MPDRSLNSLSTDFRPFADAWIALCIEHRVPVVILQTSRTPAEHRANLAAGTSGTTLSLHLPRRLRSTTLDGLVNLLDIDLDRADAMDLAPWEQYNLHGPGKVNFDASDLAWGVIAECAERVGLRSGVRWRKPFDPGHAEWVLPVKQPLLAEERTRPWPAFRV